MSSKRLGILNARPTGDAQVDVVSLPQLSPMHPLIDFPVDRIRMRIKLTAHTDDMSYIKVFDDAGREVYHIDERHRYWRAAVVNVGRMMVNNPTAFDMQG